MENNNVSEQVGLPFPKTVVLSTYWKYEGFWSAIKCGIFCGILWGARHCFKVCFCGVGSVKPGPGGFGIPVPLLVEMRLAGPNADERAQAWGAVAMKRGALEAFLEDEYETEEVK